MPAESLRAVDGHLPDGNCPLRVADAFPDRKVPQRCNSQGSESADVHHNNRKNPALSAQLRCDAGGKTGGAEGTDHFKQYIPQGKLRIKDQHQIGGCHNQKDSEHTDDGGLAECVLWDRAVEGSFGMVCCCGIDAGEQDKKGGGLDAAAGGRGRGPDKHQSGNDQQTCSREIAEVISGKTGCPGGDAVEKSAEPTDILCEF